MTTPDPLTRAAAKLRDPYRAPDEQDRLTADLLDAIQTPAERLEQRGVALQPDNYPIDRAIVAALALAAAIERQET